MDMQPLTASLEKASGKAIRRQVNYAKSSTKRYLSEAREQPSSTLSMLTTSTPDSSGSDIDQSDIYSSSKFPLLRKESKSNSNHQKQPIKAKKHSQGGSAWGSSKSSSQSHQKSGAGFKISLALFRDKGPNSHFSKMEFVASDATGNHKKNRTKSPFAPQSTSDFGSLVSSPTDEQFSFDTSAMDEPFDVLLSKKQTPNFVFRSHRSKSKCEREIDREHEAMLSVESDKSSRLGVHETPKGPKKILPTAMTSPKIASASVSSSVSSLNYSVSQESARENTAARLGQQQMPQVRSNKSYAVRTPTEETADPVTDSNIPDDVQQKLLARFELSACTSSKPSGDKTETVEASKPDYAPETGQSQTSGPSPMRTDLLRSLNEYPSRSPALSASSQALSEEANIDPPKLTSAKNTTAKKIQPLKPPPTFPPAAPRKQYMSPPSEQRGLRQHEQRLLRGGNFLNESSASSCSGTDGDLAMRILQRLEKSNAEELMKNHYDRDPSFDNMNVPSNTSTPAGTPAVTPAGTPDGRRSSSSTYTSAVRNTIDRYAGFVTGSNKSDSGVHSAEESKMNFLYSQDHEFENSILSPSSVYSQSSKPAREGSMRREHNKASRLYRSDAIQAFIAKANCPTEYSVDDDAHYRKWYRGDEYDDEYDEYDNNERDRPKVVSDEFLNMVTSGCTGGASNPNAKKTLKEKIVALEAGWTELRDQVHERMSELEESWRSWNLNNLLNFSLSGKNEPENNEEIDATTPSTVTSTIATTTSADCTPYGWQMSRDEALSSTGVTKSTERTTGQSYESTIVGEARAGFGLTGHRRTAAAENTKRRGAIEKIGIGSTEHDVPSSLRDTLADISGIDDGNDRASGADVGVRKPLDSSREDSEGGKMVLDAAEWDPVEASDHIEDIEVDLSTDPDAGKEIYYKHKNGKVLRSPTSVLLEI